jgi:hypothetical protein
MMIGRNAADYACRTLGVSHDLHDSWTRFEVFALEACDPGQKAKRSRTWQVNRAQVRST